MIVYKFGGTSIASAKMIKRIADGIIELHQEKNLIVVVSAIAETTDLLETTIHQALQPEGDYESPLSQFKQTHITLANSLFLSSELPEIVGKINIHVKQVREVLDSVHTLQEITGKTRDRILVTGELLSSLIISEFFKNLCPDVRYVNSAALIAAGGEDKTVLHEETHTRIQEEFSKFTGIAVTPGFMATLPSGRITTLGRGGSDLTAALIAEGVQAEKLTIWTDVDGIFTADPRLVPDAYPIETLSYEEALELSYFGAAVLYPPAVLPAIRGNIPVQIKNTYNPDHPGSAIQEQSDDPEIVKGISSIEHISIISISGSGMVGVVGTASRAFTALSATQINVVFISQASSEHSICIGIASALQERAVHALHKEFRQELQDKRIDTIAGEAGYSIVAVVGQKMLNTPGISGKMFEALGFNGINVYAIAQGSSERNISAVVNTTDVRKALNVLHETYFLSEIRTIHLFIAGTGNVGKEFIRMMEEQQQNFIDEFRVRFQLAGITNSRRMYLSRQGIAWHDALHLLEQGGQEANWDIFRKHIYSFNLRNAVFVDNTAAETISSYYDELLQERISIATCNKIAASGPYALYRRLKTLARDNGVHFYFDTNVGAGLPVLSSVRNLIMTGDRIHRIDAVLSGSLNFILNAVNEGASFYEALRQAMEKGFTEPDPRLDLFGVDVKRKTVILAREAGYEIEQEGVEMEDYLPQACLNADTIDDFLENVKSHDQEIRQQWEKPLQQGHKLRFVASFSEGRARLTIEGFDSEHPFYQLKDTDNMVLLHSRWYHPHPLVIKGAGAGARVTASGVLKNVFEIVQQKK